MDDDVTWAVLSSALVIAVAVSIIAAAVQLAAMRQSLHAITYRGAVEATRPYWEMLARYPQLHAVLHGGNDLEALSPDDRVRAEMAWSLRMGWYESVMLQKAAYGEFTQTTMDTWAAELRKEVRVPAFRVLWERLGDRYHPEVWALVEMELDNIRAEG